LRTPERTSKPVPKCYVINIIELLIIEKPRENSFLFKIVNNIPTIVQAYGLILASNLLNLSAAFPDYCFIIQRAIVSGKNWQDFPWLTLRLAYGETGVSLAGSNGCSDQVSPHTSEIPGGFPEIASDLPTRKLPGLTPAPLAPRPASPRRHRSEDQKAIVPFHIHRALSKARVA
jgi:hypothetical protein